MQAGGVELFAVIGKVQSDRRDLVAADRDIGFLDSASGHDRAAADDHASAANSRSRETTSIATATSSVVTDSAGLWLMPPLQRTNSIPTSVNADIATASWPAPLASSWTGWPRSRTACERSATRRGEHGTVTFSPSCRVVSRIFLRLAICEATSS